MLSFNKRKPKKKTKKRNLLLKIFLSLIVAFIATQLFVLSSVGTQGEKVSMLRQAQADIKIQNEIKRAQILQLKSNNVIRDTATDRLLMKKSSVKYINPEIKKISAQK
ncbi:MAG: hypothetical protein ACE5DX_03590 [Candidatus Dojkabacteria bacterium]